MLKALAIVGAVVVVLVAAVLVVAATKPATFRVARTATIKAPPEKIFALIDDFQKWGTWSPYEKLDPAMQRTYGATTRGKDAVYAWDGNSKVGAGRMEIVEDSSPSKVTIKLDFARPFEAHNVAEFTLKPEGNATTVTWAMDGPFAYVAKVMSVFFDMDSMIGKEFETGLANLKALAEA
ncbi:MAG TPA: SRPBCC family protein [Alphaproteobacteria bacterium]